MGLNAFVGLFCSVAIAGGLSLPVRSVEKASTGVVRVHSEFVVAKTSSEWLAAWRLPRTTQGGEVLGAGSTPQMVDFSTTMIVGVVLSSSSDGCTDVTIRSASVEATRIVINYEGWSHRSGEVCTAAFKTPYHFVAIPRSGLPVVFLRSVN